MMNNEKWYPKVGEQFEWRYMNGDDWRGLTCIAVTKKSVGFEDKNGWMACISKDYDFRQMPTKVDAEREQLFKIIERNDIYYSDSAEEIQAAGFTIPQKIKRNDVEHLVYELAGAASDSYLVRRICQLLGDFVEQDDE